MPLTNDTSAPVLLLSVIYVICVCIYSCLHWTNEKLPDMLAVSQALAVAVVIVGVIVIAGTLVVVDTHRVSHSTSLRCTSIPFNSIWFVQPIFISSSLWALVWLCRCVFACVPLVHWQISHYFRLCLNVDLFALCLLFASLAFFSAFCLPFATDLLCLQISLFVISLTFPHTHARTLLLHRQLRPNAELYSLRCQWLPAGDYLVLLCFVFLSFMLRLFSKCVCVYVHVFWHFLA